MDATQTSEPTEAEPGSSAGRASAFRRALDDQAANEGPLDLTVPLDIAEVRAALANSGPLPAVAAPPGSGTPSGPGPTPPHDPDEQHSRRRNGSKRLGRIAVFVVLAATASFGTAYALVISSGGQGSSVSLPATNGSIPVAPSAKPSSPGRLSAASGSTSASAAPSLSHSPSSVPQTTDTPAQSASDVTASLAAGSDPSASQSESTQPPSTSPGPPTAPASSAPAATWVTLYRGIQNESAEVSQVQALLQNLGFLDGWRHHEYVNPDFGAQPDPSGTYGSATENAIAQFQQENGLYGSPQGECDAATFQALSEAAG